MRTINALVKLLCEFGKILLKGLAQSKHQPGSWLPCFPNDYHYPWNYIGPTNLLWKYRISLLRTYFNSKAERIATKSLCISFPRLLGQIAFISRSLGLQVNVHIFTPAGPHPLISVGCKGMRQPSFVWFRIASRPPAFNIGTAHNWMFCYLG